MSNQLIGLIGCFAVVGLVLLRIPVAFTLAIVGFIGYCAINGVSHALLKIGEMPLEIVNYDLIVLPLFVLMGSVCLKSGMSRDVFAVANAAFAGRRGSLALASVGASAAFGAVSGSSLATVSTVAKVTVPEMRRAGYSMMLAGGSVASASTLAVLIPPSVILVIYALMSEQSLGKLYAAALLPGLLLVVLYVIIVAGWVMLQPEAAPRGPREPLRTRLYNLTKIWKIALLFGGAIGGMYAGWFSPTEGAAMGAAGAVVIGFATRSLGIRGLIDATMETVQTSAALFFIVIGAMLFAYFIVQAGLPTAFVDATKYFELKPWEVMGAIIVFYIIAGCFLDSIGMILMSVPIFLPVIVSLGYDPVWFGILLVVLVEIGLITPPVGMNCYVLRTQIPDIPIGTIFLGVAPFLLANIALIALLLMFPQIALWLPGALF